MKEFISEIFLALIALILIAAVSIMSRNPDPFIPGTTASTTAKPVTTTTSVLFSYFYPMTNYSTRIKLREFGKLVVPGDMNSLVCGFAFSGYHTADDLEVFPAEKEAAIPVFAFAKGTIIEAQTVSGYGGLIVLRNEIENTIVTSYYGHIDLNSMIKTTGDVVEAGEKIAELGEGCSSETGGERKHLHFAIMNGEEIDFRGYVNTQAELIHWLNPSEILGSVSAREPRL